ncbi:MAG: aerobic carbon-monoxide dehydrogenase large subunit, partial [Rhodospirillaceae bacterium]|nr:aerobic carbon-monoxide dehydrogenase large subunit [Rhodospirillaceae bacterium]
AAAARRFAEKLTEAPRTSQSWTAVGAAMAHAAGEAGAIGAPPAVINAIVDAIYPHTGLKHVDMPVTAASLWAAIAANRAKKAA